MQIFIFRPFVSVGNVSLTGLTGILDCKICYSLTPNRSSFILLSAVPAYDKIKGILKAYTV